jgi:hypothetical protein
MDYKKRPFAKLSDAYINEELERISAAYEGLRWFRVSKAYELSDSGTLVVADTDVTVHGVVLMASTEDTAGSNTMFHLERRGSGSNGTFAMFAPASGTPVDYGATAEGAGGSSARIWVESAGAHAKMRLHWLRGEPVKFRFFSFEVEP